MAREVHADIKAAFPAYSVVYGYSPHYNTEVETDAKVYVMLGARPTVEDDTRSTISDDIAVLVGILKKVDQANTQVPALLELEEEIELFLFHKVYSGYQWKSVTPDPLFDPEKMAANLFASRMVATFNKSVKLAT